MGGENTEDVGGPDSSVVWVCVFVGLGVLAAGLVGLVAHVLKTDSVGQWSVVAASLQAAATLLLVGVTTAYVAMVREQARAARRAADATERHVRILSQEQRVRRLDVLQDLCELAQSLREQSAKRTCDTGRPSDTVYADDDLQSLEKALPLVDKETAKATANALDSARKVQLMAPRLSEASTGDTTRMERRRFEKFNAEAAEALDSVVEKAREEIKFIRFEASISD